MKMDKLLAIGLACMLLAIGFTNAVVASEEDDELNYDLKSDESLLEGSTPDNPIMLYDVNDLQNMSLDLEAHYALANDIDANETSGWNQGAGFEPIGPNYYNQFTGSLNGRNNTITGLYINRNTDHIGLFGYVGDISEVKNIGLVDIQITGNSHLGGLIGTQRSGAMVYNSYTTGDVTGGERVGGLVGSSSGPVSNSYAAVKVNGGNRYVGGLVGSNWDGTVSNSYATANVNGDRDVGGLVGRNTATVDNSYAEGNVNGDRDVGGLVGSNSNKVENSSASCNVTGEKWYTGGLVGFNSGTVENSYATGTVIGDEYAGGLVGRNQEEGKVQYSHATGEVNGSDRVGGLVGGNPGMVSRSYAMGTVNGVSSSIGGLVGSNAGKISDSNASSTVDGNEYVGGLVGTNSGTISNSYSVSDVTGNRDVGGIVGRGPFGTLNNSHYNIDNVSINGQQYVTLGGLFQDQYEDWVDNDRELDIDDYSETLKRYDIDGFYIENIDGMKHLLGFSHVSEYTFKLLDDIDLSTESGLYIPYLAADFDGDEYNISNLHIDMDFNSYLGMFGYVEEGTEIENLGIHQANINGRYRIGGLAGYYYGNISDCHASVDISGVKAVGGLVGYIEKGTISNSFATGNVSGGGGGQAGGLVGFNEDSIVSNCHSSGTVTGSSSVGGLVGQNGDQWGQGVIENSYSTGNVSADSLRVGGLVGYNWDARVSYSFATGNVSGFDTLGGLVGYNWDGTVENSYAIGSANGTGVYIGGFVGYNREGTISNSYSTGNVKGGRSILGGFVGYNREGTIFNSYSTGDITGDETTLGGFVGRNDRTGRIEDSYSLGNIVSTYYMESELGGFVGDNNGDIVNSHYNIDEVKINNKEYITLGGLYNAQFVDWLDGRELEISDYSNTLIPMGGSYGIDSLQGMKDLLGFAAYDEYSFELLVDIDLSSEPGFHIPYLAANFDGHDRTISNLFVDIEFSKYVGMFSYVDGALVQNLGIVDVNVTGSSRVGGITAYNDQGSIYNCMVTGSIDGGEHVGGLIGLNNGPVHNSYADAIVDGSFHVGGFIGRSFGTTVSVSNCYAMGEVFGNQYLGGLIGSNRQSTVLNSYSTTEIDDGSEKGGFIGYNDQGTLHNSFWDNETSDIEAGVGLGDSDGVTGLNTTEMMKIITYLEASWDITGVESSQGNLDYIWNIVDNETYPFFGRENFIKIYTWADLYNMRNGLEGYYILMNDLTPESPGYDDYASENANELVDEGDWEENKEYEKNDLVENDGDHYYCIQDHTADSENEPGEGIWWERYWIETDKDEGETLGWNPVGSSKGIDPQFRGSLDGNGHTITGLYINRSDEDFVGLFGYTIDASITNVGLIDVNITGKDEVGALVGWNKDSTVTNSFATGELNGVFYLGGLIGKNEDGTVSNSSAAVTVTGGYIIGGLVGDNLGIVENSYATSTVDGSDEIGGLLGYHLGTVTKSYSTGAVSGDGDIVGGFMGLYGAGEIKACFYDYETSGQSEGAGSPSPIDPDGIERKTTEEMQTMGTFTDAGWDFDDIWWIVEDETYPLHRWVPIYNVDSQKPFNNIQCAVDAPSTLEDHTIFVSSGTYYENIWVHKSINLIGSGIDETYIDADGKDFGMIIMANHTTVRGFTFMNATGGDPGAGIALLNPKENVGGGGPPETHPLENCNLDYVKSINNNHSVILLDIHDSTIANSDFSHSTSENIILMGSTYNTITNNTCNHGEVGIMIMGSNYNEIYENDASSNIFGTILIESEYNTIHNNTANYNEPAGHEISGIGIALAEGSNHNELSDNEIFDNVIGILNAESVSNTFTGNEMANNGLAIMGNEVEHWNTHEIDAMNTVNGDPVRYLKDQIGGTIEEPAGQIILANCTGVNVEDSDISGSTVGILLGFSQDNYISDNTLSDQLVGLALFNSVNNHIDENNIYSNQLGIILEDYSHENHITDNSITNNEEGIQIFESNNNIIYHNIFIENDNHAYDEGDNSWDNGYPSGGNYWDDHITPDEFRDIDQNIPGSDGIVDDVRLISGGDNVDNYPWINSEFALVITVSDPDPQDGATSIALDTKLSVYVEMQEKSTEVYFYLDEVLVHQETIDSSGYVETDPLEELEYQKDYQWYVVTTNDGGNNHTRSQDYSFQTITTYWLTVNIVGDGSVNVDEEPVSSGWSQPLDEGIVTLQVTSDAGWEFVEWTGDTENIANVNSDETTIDLKGDYTITANFEMSEYELIVNSTDGGSVINPGEGNFTYEYGTLINLEAQADTNYVFVEWTGDTDTIHDVYEGQTTMSIEGDYEITAVFELEYEFYELTVDIVGGGEVSIFPSPDPTMDKYEEGTTVYLTAISDDGWEFSHWEGDVQEGQEEYDDINIYMDSDKTVTAHFVEEYIAEFYELTVNVEGGGSVNIDPDQVTYEHGTRVYLDAMPSLGWEFSHWTGDYPSGGAQSHSINIEMDNDKTVTAHFVEEDAVRYELNINLDGKGTVDIEPELSHYAEGTTVTLTAIPDHGWRFIEWTGDVTGYDTEAIVYMYEDKTITAVFEESEAEVSVTNFVVDPTDGHEPLTVHITAEIENIGDIEATITLYIGDETINSWTLKPGETTTVDETYKFESVGLYYVDLGDKTITVNVGDVITYTLDVNVDGQGTVSFTPDRSEYQDHDEVTITAVAADGWKFLEWSGDHEDTEDEITITIDKDKTITAIFVEDDDEEPPDDEALEDHDEEESFMDPMMIALIAVVIAVTAGVIFFAMKKKPSRTPPSSQPEEDIDQTENQELDEETELDEDQQDISEEEAPEEDIEPE